MGDPSMQSDTELGFCPTPGLASVPAASITQPPTSPSKAVISVRHRLWASRNGVGVQCAYNSLYSLISLREKHPESIPRPLCVWLRVLHGALEGGLVLWLPVFERLQPKDDPEVQEAAGELPCHVRHGAELYGSRDQPGPRTQGWQMHRNCPHDLNMLYCDNEQ